MPELAELSESVNDYHNNLHKNEQLAAAYATQIREQVTALGIVKDLGIDVGTGGGEIDHDLMHEIEEKSTAHGTAFRLVSFSVDPAYDTPEILAAYATRHHADLARWSFLTGPPGAVEETVVGGMKISMGRPTVETPVSDLDSVFHGTKALLIDQKMQIRGYYALEDRGGFGRLSGVDQLIADAEFLMGKGPGS